MDSLKNAYSIYGPAIGQRRQLEIAGEKTGSATKQTYLSRTRCLDHPPPHNGGACHGLPASTRWWLSNPEMNRKRRVSGYKVYAVEGKVKASVRKGLRWIKGKYSELVHGR